MIISTKEARMKRKKEKRLENEQLEELAMRRFAYHTRTGRTLDDDFPDEVTNLSEDFWTVLSRMTKRA